MMKKRILYSNHKLITVMFLKPGRALCFDSGPLLKIRCETLLGSVHSLAGLEERKGMIMMLAGTLSAWSPAETGSDSGGRGRGLSEADRAAVVQSLPGSGP